MHMVAGLTTIYTFIMIKFEIGFAFLNLKVRRKSGVRKS